MIIVNDESDLPRIATPAIRQLVALRLQQLSPVASTPTPCEFIVVEGGEAVSEIEQAVGFPILTSLFDDISFDHPDFYPNHEILEEYVYEHCRFFEMVFGFGADGAVAIFIPDQENVSTDLLSMCRSWATPAVSTP